MIFSHQNYTLGYSIFGDGPETLLAFHGFGQSPDVFRNILPAFRNRYTIYSIALFYHGSSLPSQSGEIIDPAMFTALINAFCSQNNIGRCALLGYSMGGRLALAYFGAEPVRVSRLLLFAPDGIRKSFWYHFATHNPLGKKLFRKMVAKPALFFRVLGVFRSLGIISEKLQRFTVSQFGSEANRSKVFNVWNVYSRLLPVIPEIKALIRQHRVPAIIFTGTYDPVLDSSIGKSFASGMEPLVAWHPMHAGHDLLREIYAEEIGKALAAQDLQA